MWGVEFTALMIIMLCSGGCAAVAQRQIECIIIKVELFSDRLVTAALLPMFNSIIGDDVVMLLRDAFDVSDLSTTSLIDSEICRRFCASTCLKSRAS